VLQADDGLALVTTDLTESTAGASDVHGTAGDRGQRPERAGRLEYGEFRAGACCILAGRLHLESQWVPFLYRPFAWLPETGTGLGRVRTGDGFDC
jgi:hypothetical protein